MTENSSSTGLVFEVAYFLGTERRTPSPDTIHQVLGGLENLRAVSGSGKEKVYEYLNRDSGVSCRFVAYPVSGGSEVGLSFEMDLPRPTFFALETLPLIVSVARELRLRVKIMEPESSGEPFNPTVEDLILHWREANQNEVDYLTEQGTEPPYAPADELEAMWEYMLLRADLARRYGRKAVAVPPVRLFCLRSDGEVYRYVEWERFAPTVLPDADWVKLVSPPAPLKDGALYRLPELAETLKGCVKDSTQPINHRICERGPSPEQLALVARLKAETMKSFQPLEYWEVVDDG